jgi:hypothetical protein
MLLRKYPTGNRKTTTRQDHPQKLQTRSVQRNITVQGMHLQHTFCNTAIPKLLRRQAIQRESCDCDHKQVNVFDRVDALGSGFILPRDAPRLFKTNGKQLTKMVFPIVAEDPHVLRKPIRFV